MGGWGWNVIIVSNPTAVKVELSCIEVVVGVSTITKLLYDLRKLKTLRLWKLDTFIKDPPAAATSSLPIVPWSCHFIFLLLNLLKITERGCSPLNQGVQCSVELLNKTLKSAVDQHCVMSPLHHDQIVTDMEHQSYRN